MPGDTLTQQITLQVEHAGFIPVQADERGKVKGKQAAAQLRANRPGGSGNHDRFAVKHLPYGPEVDVSPFAAEQLSNVKGPIRSRWETILRHVLKFLRLKVRARI
jgi:hypothetical protein